eukprot:gene35027-43191_t
MKQSRYLELMKEHLTIKGLTLTNADMYIEIETFFHNQLRMCASHCLDTCVEWLLDGPWKLLERLPQAIANPVEYLNGLIAHSLDYCSPSYVMFAKIFQKEDVPLVREKLKLELYTLMSRWDAMSLPAQFAQNLLSKWQSDPSSAKSRPRLSDPFFGAMSDTMQRDLFDVYIREFARSVSSRSKEHVFKYLVGKAESTIGRADIPLHLFVLHDQPQLLLWYVERYKIDLQAPLSSDADLLRFAQDQPWTYNADGLFQSALTVDQFIQRLVTSGDQPSSIFFYNGGGKLGWNMDFTYNGLSLTQFAVASGSYFMYPSTKGDFSTPYCARNTTIPMLATYYKDMVEYQ